VIDPDRPEAAGEEQEKHTDREHHVAERRRPRVPVDPIDQRDARRGQPEQPDDQKPGGLVTNRQRQGDESGQERHPERSAAPRFVDPEDNDELDQGPGQEQRGDRQRRGPPARGPQAGSLLLARSTLGQEGESEQSCAGNRK
jgi:hypothetical protein